MEQAFHIIMVIIFTCQAITALVKGDDGTDFVVFLLQLFLAVWAWLHLFKVW